MIIESKYMYDKGCLCFAKKSYVNAREFFELCKYDSSLGYMANLMLIRIDLLEGKYNEASIKLSELVGENNYLRTYLKSLILKGHFKLEQALEYALTLKDMESTRLINALNNEDIIFFNYNLGNIRESDDLVQKAVKDRELSNISHFWKACLLALEDKYEEAYFYLQKVDKNKLKKNVALYDKYSKLRFFVLTKLGKDYRSFNLDSCVYLKEILFGSDQNILINHISLHKEKITPNAVSFLNELDIKKLIEEVKEKIETITPYRDEIVSVYPVTTDKIVSRYKGREIKTIKVISAFKTKKIISMFPIDYAEDLSFLENDTLKRKQI